MSQAYSSRAAKGPHARVGSSPLLELRGVAVAFPGQSEPVLADLDVTVSAGEFIAVVGPSGSGKTTLLRAVHGLLPVATGEVLLDGQFVRGPSRSRGFVFQSDCLLPWRTVIDNVGYPLELHGASRRDARAGARELLAMTGLADCAYQYPAQLSGGMRQRVNLARALVSDPEMLLMDEPFAALDAQTREVLQAELLSIWGRRTKTVLFVTHQLDEAVYLADRVIVLAAKPGRVREIVQVDLTRPRALDVKRTPEFTEQVDVIWQLIKGDVLEQRKVG